MLAGRHARSSTALVVLLVFKAVFLISPVVYLLGFRTVLVVPLALATFVLVALLHERRLPLPLLFTLFFAFITSCVSGVYWESWKAAFFPALLGTSILVAALATSDELKRVVSIGSVVLLVFLIGAWISLLLALSGVPALGHIYSASERMLYVYPSTLTTVVVGNFIRPAGIYDEPGAFSFVVCAFAFLRHIMHMDRRVTWLLLLLGFVTFSLAHLIYVTIHLIAERRVIAVWASLGAVICVAAFALSFTGVWEHFDARLAARLSVSANSERIVAGDNRSAKMVRAYKALSKGGAEALVFGIDKSCVEGTLNCRRRYPDMGENPLSPAVHSGLLLTWPYYLFLLFAFVAGASQRPLWPLVGIGLLFLQRPSVMSMGYSALAALIVIYVVRHSLYRPKFTSTSSPVGLFARPSTWMSRNQVTP